MLGNPFSRMQPLSFAQTRYAPSGSGQSAADCIRQEGIAPSRQRAQLSCPGSSAQSPGTTDPPVPPVPGFPPIPPVPPVPPVGTPPVPPVPPVGCGVPPGGSVSPHPSMPTAKAKLARSERAAFDRCISPLLSSDGRWIVGALRSAGNASCGDALWRPFGGARSYEERRRARAQAAASRTAGWGCSRWARQWAASWGAPLRPAARRAFRRMPWCLGRASAVPRLRSA